MRPRRLATAAIPLGLAVVSYAIALLQRPGWASSDTKIDLHVAPARFLSDVASTWTATGSLGHVQGGQYGGYLFPMGPWFAAGHAVGLAPWLVQRLWLGTLFALGCWGIVRLLDALLDRDRGAAQLVAGAIFLLNPYVVVFSARTSVTLLGYAALPWLLLAVHRGLRASRSWWWPAAFALLITSTGGGVNAAVTAWVLLGPVLLLAYELLLGGVSWGDARRFTVRAAAATLAVSLWWIVPVLVQALYGIDFLKFTEQPGTIWGTTSVAESLRLMGYWLSYIGVGFTGTLHRFFDDSGTLLFAPAVLVATFAVPGLALAGFAWTRRWRYGPFFLALTLLGLTIMVAGFPEGTPLRRGLTFTYNHVSAVQFLRTSYKAGPLVALGLAALGGAAAGQLWSRLRGLPPPRRALAPTVAVAGAALLVLAALPFFQGRAVDRQLEWKRIPTAWTRAAHELDRQLPRNARAVVLPGQLFAFYRWGGTIDPILPALSRRPVAVRNIVPYADLHAIDLLWTVDALVGQQRAFPGQLRPLLGLLGARAVVSATDDDRGRSGGPNPVLAAGALAEQGLGPPSRSYGPLTSFPSPAGELDPGLALPQVRRYDLPPGRGVVRVEPAGPGVVVDGSADALAALAAFGALPQKQPIVYAGDRSAAQVRRAAAAGAEIVVSDSNRRRVFVAARLAQNAGPTLGSSDPVSADAPVLDPFAGRGSDAQTVAVYEGARYVRSLYSPGFSLFPEHRAFAAFDGSPETAWIADRNLTTGQRWVEVGLDRSRDVPYVDVLPFDDQRAVVEAVEIAGRRFAIHAGWNRLSLRLHHVNSLRLRIARTSFLQEPRGGGSLAEVRVPGLHVRELLRPPVLAERALAGRDLRRTALTYVFSRTVGDGSFRRTAFGGPPGAQAVRDRRDGEAGLARLVDPPAPRSYETDAWVSVTPGTLDSELDRLAGLRSPARFDSSSRFESQSRYRASGAFDGGRGRTWIGDYVPGRPAWIGWKVPRPLVLRRLRIVPAKLHVRSPTRIRVSWPGGASPPLAVGAGGEVVLPRAVRARSFRLDVLDARFPPGTTPSQQQRRAVAIGELMVPGVAPVAPPLRGPLRADCSLVRIGVGGRTLGLRVEGDVASLDAGRPLRARGCGAPLVLAAGRQELRTKPGPFAVDLLRLRSPAPAGATTTLGGGRVLDPGRAGRGSYDGIRIATAGPAWLVLGESYNRGWRAWCDGRSLGAPTVIDGYANGWRLRRACRHARFAFAPNGPVTWAYWLSALAALVLLGVLALRRPARTATFPPGAARLLPVVDRPAPWPAGRAAVAALAAGSVLGFAFAARAGPAIAAGVFLILWRGIDSRALVAIAGCLLVVVVPALYLLFPTPNRQGDDFNYPVDHIAGHWVAVAAVVLLVIVLVRTLAIALNTARGPSDGPAPAQADEAAPPARA